MLHIDPGTAVIDPSGPFVAGAFTTIDFTYTTGHPIDDTGFILITFRFAADFGTPQFDRPDLPNFCSIRTTASCRLQPRWDPKGHTRPWGNSIFLKVTGGFLDCGDRVFVRFGDTAGGSPGWRMQTFCEETFEFKTFVDPIATFEFKELHDSPTLRIIPGKPERAVCIAPSQAVVKTPFTYHVKHEDRWGNPTGLPEPKLHPGFEKAGIHFVESVGEKEGFSAKSNPIEVVPDPPRLRRYWADFHGQSEETLGTNTIADYFTFARDYALVDVGAHQGNDFQITDDFWKTINRTTRRFYKPGAFVTFPGYEWSGNTPLGGDRNVYFAHEGGVIHRSCTDLLPGKTSAFPDSPTAAELFEDLKRQKGPKAFAFAHVGGRYADLRVHDPEVELAVEVHSAWGTFEWLVEDALRLGYRVGICANSDGHKGRPGASYPGAGKFGSLGGYTCIFARKLDRKHILDAIRARHFYATTGNRALMEVSLVTRDGRRAMMGDVVAAVGGSPELEVHLSGTAPIERVDIRNGTRTVRAVRPFEGGDSGRRIKIVWSGAEVRGRARMASWDGNLRVSGNRIREIVPINFRNPDELPERIGEDRLSWKSVTTGGIAGVILTLEDPKEGVLTLQTGRRTLRLAVKTAKAAPRIWEFGGLGKRIEIYRLPDRPEISQTLSFRTSIEDLAPGENPIYVRMVQEDGHMAWSSPIYLSMSA